MKRAILLLTVLVASVLSGCDADDVYMAQYNEHVTLYSGTEIVREWHNVHTTSTSYGIVHVASQNGDYAWIQGTFVIEEDKE